MFCNSSSLCMDVLTLLLVRNMEQFSDELQKLPQQSSNLTTEGTLQECSGRNHSIQLATVSILLFPINSASDNCCHLDGLQCQVSVHVTDYPSIWYSWTDCLIKYYLLLIHSIRWYVYTLKGRHSSSTIQLTPEEEVGSIQRASTSTYLDLETLEREENPQTDRVALVSSATF